MILILKLDTGAISIRSQLRKTRMISLFISFKSNVVIDIDGILLLHKAASK